MIDTNSANNFKNLLDSYHTNVVYNLKCIDLILWNNLDARKTPQRQYNTIIV